MQRLLRPGTARRPIEMAIGTTKLQCTANPSPSRHENLGALTATDIPAHQTQHGLENLLEESEYALRQEDVGNTWQAARKYW